MKYHPQLYSLAQEWAKLRQDAKSERDPNKIVAIVDRLNVLLLQAGQLTGWNDERFQSKGRRRLDAKPCAERELRSQ